MNKEYYKKWKPQSFTRAKKFELYINEIKERFVGKTISRFLIKGTNYNSDDGYIYKDDSNKINVSSSYDILDGTKQEGVLISVDEPIILVIDGIQLEIDLPGEASSINISINQFDISNTGKYNCQIHDYEHDWRDISFAYTTNIINQKIDDIYINKTKTTRIIDAGLCSGQDGDDMFYELCIKMANGYELVFSEDLDYTIIEERKFYKNRQQITNVLDKYYKEDNKYNFYEFVDNSKPLKTDNFEIIPNINKMKGIFEFVFNINSCNYKIPLENNILIEFLYFIEGLADKNTNFWQQFISVTSEGIFAIHTMSWGMDNNIRFVHLWKDINKNNYKVIFDIYTNSKELISKLYKTYTKSSELIGTKAYSSLMNDFMGH